MCLLDRQLQRVNERWPAVRGMKLLCLVANATVRNELRCSDTVGTEQGTRRPGDLARLGGDEFRALPDYGVAGRQGTSSRAVNWRLARTEQLATTSLVVTPSVGIAVSERRR